MKKALTLAELEDRIRESYYETIWLEKMRQGWHSFLYFNRRADQMDRGIALPLTE